MIFYVVLMWQSKAPNNNLWIEIAAVNCVGTVLTSQKFHFDPNYAWRNNFKIAPNAGMVEPCNYRWFAKIIHLWVSKSFFWKYVPEYKLKNVGFKLIQLFPHLSSTTCLLQASIMLTDIPFVRKPLIIHRIPNAHKGFNPKCI